MSKGLDLSLPDDVLEYLSKTQFASIRAVPLSGGNANFIFRLYLQTPYDGRETLVMKHAKPWVARFKEFKFSVERQNFEAKALQSVNAFLPEGSLATVPKLHFHDSDTHVLIIDDCGPDTHNLKQLLLDGAIDPDNARQIGHALGAFLATVHMKGSEDQELVGTVAKNLEARQLNTWMTYGRLVETLKGVGVDKALVDPPLVETNPKEDIETIDQISRDTTKAIMDADSIFTMGDFWTGNVIVRTAQNGQKAVVDRIFVVDWEATCPGFPYLDFGQMAAELHLLRRFSDESKENVDVALEAFFTAYRELVDVGEPFARGAAARLGAHLVAWTPRVGWEPSNRVREIVQEGVEYLLMSKAAELDALKKSIMGPLLQSRAVR